MPRELPDDDGLFSIAARVPHEAAHEIKLIVGIILGLLIGVACRWFDIPAPSPPKLAGALLVVAMTVGYMVTDKLIGSRFSTKGPASTQDLCGGPTGNVISARPP